MVQVSHPERVVFPAAGHTKGEVVAYYERAAPRMLPHVAGRPISIRRYPKGLAGQGFFQKNAPAHYPDFIGRVELPRREGGVTVYPTVSTAEGLAYLGNQGAIEIHAPTVRGEDLFHPDRIVIDLDPPAKKTELAREAARVVRGELEALGVPTVPVATGSKGYHVVAVIRPTVDFDSISATMHRLATLLARRHPDLLTVAFRIAKRGPRVFVDWLRNAHAATVVAPFSLRARPAASIAVPIGWDEIERTPSDHFRLATIDERLQAPDPLVELAPVDPAPFVAAVAAAFDEAGLVLETFDRFRD